MLVTLSARDCALLRQPAASHATRRMHRRLVAELSGMWKTALVERRALTSARRLRRSMHFSDDPSRVPQPPTKISTVAGEILCDVPGAASVR
jgi:hypothetical protein